MGAAGGEGGGGGGGRSVSPLQIPPGERRATLNRWLAEAARRQSSGWRPEDEIMNSHTLQRGHLIHRKRDNRIELRSEGQSQAPRAPQPDSMPRASTSVGGGFQQAERIRQHAMEVRALATANRLTKKVHDYLARNYPESTLGWVGDAEWDGPKHVKLSDIDMARRPGGRDQSKVQGIARAMTQDPSGALVNEPVVLVKVPGSDKLVVADGYHRTLAHKRVGHGRVLGYVGTVDQTEGPWDREMHDKKINREDEPTSVEVPTVETIDAWVAQHEAELEAMLP